MPGNKGGRPKKLKRGPPPGPKFEDASNDLEQLVTPARAAPKVVELSDDLVRPLRELAQRRDAVEKAKENSYRGELGYLSERKSGEEDRVQLNLPGVPKNFLLDQGKR